MAVLLEVGAEFRQELRALQHRLVMLEVSRGPAQILGGPGLAARLQREADQVEALLHRDALDSRRQDGADERLPVHRPDDEPVHEGQKHRGSMEDQLQVKDELRGVLR